MCGIVYFINSYVIAEAGLAAGGYPQGVRGGKQFGNVFFLRDAHFLVILVMPGPADTRV